METGAWRAASAFLTVLRTHVSIEESARDGHLQSGCGALVFTLHVESTVDEQRRVRVALDLLHTLWVVNRDAWREAMRSAVGVKMPASLVTSVAELPAAPLTVVASVKHDKFPAQVHRARWVTLLDPVVRMTDAEARVKRHLLRAYGRGQAQICIPVIPLRLQFLVFGVATRVVEAYVTNAVEMVEAVRDCLQHSPTSHSLDVCAPFSLDALELDVSPYEMTSGIARQVMRLHALRIRFHRLHIRIIQHEATANGQDEDDTTDRDRLMTVLLGPVDGEFTVSGNSFPIETLVLDRADLVQFRAACTALESTRCVKNVHLQNVFTFDTPADRGLKWEWFTRAVFAPSSQTSIKHVWINQTDIEFSDVAVVASTLQAVAQEGNGGTHALETLVIAFEASHNDALAAIPRLLELIGEQITALSIYLWLGTLTEDLVVETLRVCPRLRFLDLSNVELDSMDVFFDAYEGGDCQIRSLALHQVDVPNATVTAFAQALCDPSGTVAQTLRELSLDSVGEQDELNQANLDAFHALLETHGSALEYLELRASKELVSVNQSRFRAHHKTWGTVVAALVPRACKSALLSVCQQNAQGRKDASAADDEPLSPVGKLDHHVLSLIFEFAATRSWRNVYIDEP